MAEVYLSCIFSVHPKTTREVREFIFSRGHLHLPAYVPINEVPTNFPNNNLLLDMCRNQLYEVYIEEQKWSPDPNVHTQFQIRTSELTGKQMLCDRYDEKSFWVVVLTSDFKVIALQRAMTSYLLQESMDLDVLGYDNCPTDMHKWVTYHQTPVGEISRTVIHKDHRRKYLFAYINYHLAVYMLNENYWGRNIVALATFPENKPHLQFMKLVQGIFVKDWTFKYHPSDEYASIVFITYADKIEQGIRMYFDMFNRRSKL